jgi:hypothetical protein
VARRLIAILEAKDLASPEIRKLARHLHELGPAGGIAGQALTGLSRATGVLGVVAGAVGAVQIGRMLVGGLQSFVAGAAKAEESEARMAAALRATGQTVSTELPKLIKRADALELQTAIAGDVILANQAMLVSIGKLSGDGLDRATRAAVNFAAATGKDLPAIMELVAKAAAGNTGQLSRYGITLDESIPKADKFAAALAKIEQIGGEAASAKLGTLNGQVLLFKELIGGTTDVLGGPFLEVGREVLKEFVNPLANDLKNAAEDGNAYRLAVLEAALATLKFAEAVEVAGGPLLKLAFVAGEMGFDKLTRDLQAVANIIDRFGASSDSLNQSFSALTGSAGGVAQAATDAVSAFFDPPPAGGRETRVSAAIAAVEALIATGPAEPKGGSAPVKELGETSEGAAKQLEQLQKALEAIGLTTRSAAAAGAKELSEMWQQAQGKDVSRADFLRAFGAEIEKQVALARGTGIEIPAEIRAMLPELADVQREASRLAEHLQLVITPTVEMPDFGSAPAFELPDVDLAVKNIADLERMFPAWQQIADIVNEVVASGQQLPPAMAAFANEVGHVAAAMAAANEHPEVLAELLRQANAELNKMPSTIKSIEEAFVSNLMKTGAALDKNKDGVADLGASIQNAMVGVAADGAGVLGSALADTLFQTKVDWSELAKQMLRDIAKIAFQLIILKALQAATSGGSAAAGGGFGSISLISVHLRRGGVAGHRSGGVAGLDGVLHAQNGMYVPGLDVGRDSVPAMLTPGELVIPRGPSTQLLRDLGASPTPGGPVPPEVINMLQWVSQRKRYGGGGFGFRNGGVAGGASVTPFRSSGASSESRPQRSRVLSIQVTNVFQGTVMDSDAAERIVDQSGEAVARKIRKLARQGRI